MVSKNKGRGKDQTWKPAETAANEAQAEDMTKELEISVLLKGKDVLFVEAGSELVDILVRVLQQPLGAVVGCVAKDDAKTSLSQLQGSIAALRDPLFTDGKKDKQKYVAKPLKIDAMLMCNGHGPESRDVSGLPLHGHDVQVSKTSETGFAIQSSQGTWHGSVFKNADADATETNSSFEMTWKHDNNANGYFVGFVPDEELLSQKVQTHGGFYHVGCGVHIHIQGNRMANVYYQSTYTAVSASHFSPGMPFFQSLVPGREYTLRVCSGVGKQAKIDLREAGCEKWYELKLHWNAPAVKFVPSIHVCSTRLEISKVVFEQSQAGLKPILHQVARFLIANDLEVCESSSLKAVQIMQKYEVHSAKDLQVRTIAFGARELRRLIGRALCGEADVLQYALKDALADASDGAESVADTVSHTEHAASTISSFDILPACNTNAAADA
eukprot:TRINITY_DN102728_c0_g1_i1.p1 TRINITY_DN102728_c0_g1~~TRINITY_DN102728_c0_g1_i1.p1  ORF type:complete len:441 (-),score=116.70 TRINITY_DN102728_c0_g1_i1:143-1465(-)